MLLFIKSSYSSVVKVGKKHLFQIVWTWIWWQRRSPIFLVLLSLTWLGQSRSHLSPSCHQTQRPGDSKQKYGPNIWDGTEIFNFLPSRPCSDSLRELHFEKKRISGENYLSLLNMFLNSSSSEFQHMIWNLWNPFLPFYYQYISQTFWFARNTMYIKPVADWGCAVKNVSSVDGKKLELSS